ncbi:right-handed parallel beta-helix repeat-containing protein [Cerasicoccus maritimus]|uniref:right-handed parallel beta-helix repeat-containing protein n=1 Tax=Cerasicoccus maritimus TaxID=490089 RepID=UPI002852B708|nr:right-handed parallel beta-helix repeat-containing protein [Cerasicoccus maritimus]
MKQLAFKIIICVIYSAITVAAAPDWWVDRDVATPPPIAPGEPEFDQVLYDAWMEGNYSPALQGQAKQLAKQAYFEMEAISPGSAGEEIEALVLGFSTDLENNYKPLLLGQLKMIAKVFYDRFYEIGYAPNGITLHDVNDYWYPWDDETPVERNYAPANLGQLKYVLSFDFDGLPQFAQGWGSDGDPEFDAWRTTIVDHDLNDDIVDISQVYPGDDYDGDGANNALEYLLDLDPTTPDPDVDADGDGFPNEYEVRWGTDASDSSDYPQIPGENVNGDGKLYLVDASLTSTDTYRKNTLNSAISLARNGDIVFVKQGVYYEEVEVNENSEYADEAFLIIGERGAVIDGNDSVANGVSFNFGTNVFWVGIDVRNFTGSAFHVYASGPTIRNSTAYGSGRGIHINRANHGTTSRIENCIFRDNIGENPGAEVVEGIPVFVNCTFYNNVATSEYSGLYNEYDVNKATHSKLYNCVFWNTGGAGQIGRSASTNVTLLNCIVRDENSDGIGDYNATSVTNIYIEDPVLSDSGRIIAGSAAIDQGTNDTNYPRRDIDGNPRVRNSLVDIGASEFYDSDSDGLTDWFEKQVIDARGGGDDNSVEPTDDDDGDQLSAIVEMNLGTNPLSLDSDSDGASDWLEYDLGYSPVTSNLDDDADGDGFPNAYEVRWGTDASDSSDYPQTPGENDSGDGKLYLVDVSLTTTDTYRKNTLNSALSLARNGDIVFVKQGVYYEEVQVNKSTDNELFLVIGEQGAVIDGTNTLTNGVSFNFHTNVFWVGIDVRNFTGSAFNVYASGPTIRNSTAYGSGRGININEANHGTASWIENCIFRDNAGVSPGAMVDSGNPTFVNCTFCNNVATSGHSGLYNEYDADHGTHSKLYNCVFWNTGGAGQIGRSASTNVTLVNCIVRDENSDGIGDFDASTATNVSIGDPLLNASAHITPGSSAIGGALLSMSYPRRDIDGQPRFHYAADVVDDIADIGADEYSTVGVDFDLDDDGDGLSNGEELLAGTDPDEVDTDGDGLSDYWELQYGYNPVLAEPLADADGDGIPNQYEQRWGTDAGDQADFPNVSGPNGFDGGILYIVDAALPDDSGTYDKKWIQSAVDEAVSGDIIYVKQGSYLESVEVSDSDLLIVGERGAMIDGEDLRSQGITLNGSIILDRLDISRVAGNALETKASSSIIRNVASYNSSRGVYVDQGSPLFENCVVRDNTGANPGVYTRAGEPEFVHCTIINNTATSGYSGVYNTWINGLTFKGSGRTSLVNCIVWNSGGSGQIGRENHDRSTISLRNCIVRDEDGDGDGEYYANVAAEVIVGDPDVTRTGRILKDSVGIDAATLDTNFPRRDIDGILRTSSALNDIGASEYLNSDADVDDLPDWFEALIVSNRGTGTPNSVNNDDDDDGDGLSALGEYLNGSDPFLVDTDSDGANDYLEYQLGSDSLISDDLADSDGDRFPNQWELWAGSDASDAESYPTLAGALTYDDADGQHFFIVDSTQSDDPLAYRYQTIQGAIDAALNLSANNRSHVIGIKPGLYHESLVIPDQTNGGQSFDVLIIALDQEGGRVILDGVTADSKLSDGILIGSNDYAPFSNIIIDGICVQNFEHGIIVGDYVNVRNSELRFNQSAILSSRFEPRFDNCLIHHNNGAVTIENNRSVKTKFVNCTITNNIASDAVVKTRSFYGSTYKRNSNIVFSRCILDNTTLDGAQKEVRVESDHSRSSVLRFNDCMIRGVVDDGEGGIFVDSNIISTDGDSSSQIIHSGSIPYSSLSLTVYGHLSEDADLTMDGHLTEQGASVSGIQLTLDRNDDHLRCDYDGEPRVIGAPIYIGADQYQDDDETLENNDVPDYYEKIGGTDDDGLDLLAEFLASTLPNENDTDGDSVDDDIEIALYLSPLKCDYWIDADRDRVPNWYEKVWGTDGGDSLDKPNATIASGNVDLEYYTVDGAASLQAAIASISKPYSIIELVEQSNDTETVTISDQEHLLILSHDHAQISANSGAGMKISGGSVILNGLDFTTSSPGLVLYGDATRVERCRFYGNTIGLSVNSYSSARIYNSEFYSNTGENGAAVNTNGDSKPIFYGCYFYGNRASNEGGAVWARFSSPSFFNCTFADNRASVSGNSIRNHFGDNPLYQFERGVSLYNSIVWSGHPGSEVGGWHADLVFFYTCIVPSVSAPGSYDSNCKEQDPLLVSPLYQEGTGVVLRPYRLSSESPAINEGDWRYSHAHFDSDDDYRLNESLDIGADEWLDTDADSLPDSWELNHFSNLSQTGTDQGNDDDGIDYSKEYALGLDPAVWNGVQGVTEVKQGIDTSNLSSLGVVFDVYDDTDVVVDFYGVKFVSDANGLPEMWVTSSEIHQELLTLAAGQGQVVSWNPSQFPGYEMLLYTIKSTNGSETENLDPRSEFQKDRSEEESDGIAYDVYLTKWVDVSWEFSSLRYLRYYRNEFFTVSVGASGMKPIIIHNTVYPELFDRYILDDRETFEWIPMKGGLFKTQTGFSGYERPNYTSSYKSYELPSQSFYYKSSHVDNFRVDSYRIRPVSGALGQAEFELSGSATVSMELYEPTDLNTKINLYEVDAAGDRVLLEDRAFSAGAHQFAFHLSQYNDQDQEDTLFSLDSSNAFERYYRVKIIVTDDYTGRKAVRWAALKAEL